jgi:hypothetical protein
MCIDSRRKDTPDDSGYRLHVVLDFYSLVVSTVRVTVGSRSPGIYHAFGSCNCGTAEQCSSSDPQASI